MFLFFGKKKVKEPFVVLMTFSRETYAEFAKNTLKEDQILAKIIKWGNYKYNPREFMYMNFINDDNKIFKVLFQVNIKDNAKEKERLSTFVEDVFDCNDIKIENKKDFNFQALNLKHGLVKNDILIISKDNKQELRPRNTNGAASTTPSINQMNANSDSAQKNDFLNNYDFKNVVAKPANFNEDESFKNNSFDTTGLFGKSVESQQNSNQPVNEENLFRNNDENNGNIVRNFTEDKEFE